MKKMTCSEARLIDMVDYLADLGFQPQKIRNQDYWFCSPLRRERTASFKVNRTRNIWYDFGEGKGGDLIDFGALYFKCSVNELLEQLTQYRWSRDFSFHPHLNIRANKASQIAKMTSNASEKENAHEGKILILGERPLSSPSLLHYLEKRCIPLEIARRFCREVDFSLYGKQYTTIGFRNDKGGFELRNEHFKGSSSPKSTTLYDQGSSEVAVFEGFFDFLSYQALHETEQTKNTNYLVLNSLSFFHQARDLMERHEAVHLYLDRNQQGIKSTREALTWDRNKYIDQSKSLKYGEDLNDWLVRKHTRKSLELIIKPATYHHGRGKRI